MIKLLIIEDDPIISRIYRGKYELAGYEVATALDGETGLAMIKEKKPDLVQLDLQLPTLSGVEVIKQIRAQPELKSLPIILLSNCYLSDQVKAAWAAGATKCLSKLNCTPNVMLHIIEELLNPSVPLAIEEGTAKPPTLTLPAIPTKPATSTDEFGLGTTQGEVRQEFLNRAPIIKTNLGQQLHAMIKCGEGPDQLVQLQELYRTVHFLAALAGLTGFFRIAHLAGALDVLLKELYGRPKQITPSTLRTITQAVDCIGHLFGGNSDPLDEVTPSTLILAVDDEPISRQALRTALGKVNLRSVSLEDPHLALRILQENRFDLIFLDVEMPAMDGFALCKELRALPANKTTPVVFVTSTSDFKSRAQSILSGGNELIAKPFLLMELAVKALTFLLKPKTSELKMETNL
jgi:CheY-like chemotaxis protein